MGDLFTEKSGDGRIHPQRSSESLPLPLPLPLPRNTFTWNDGNGIQKKKKTRLLPLKDCHYVELVTSSKTGTLFTSTTKARLHLINDSRILYIIHLQPRRPYLRL